MTDYTLTEDEWNALSEAAEAPGGRGDEFQVASNVDSDTDNVRVRRVGPAGGGLKARVVVFVETLIESEDEDVEDEIQSSLAYISAPEARQLAAALLNVADEIDGKTPLVFFPRAAGETAADVTATEVVGDGWKNILIGQRVRVIGNHGGDYRHFFPTGEEGTVVQIEVDDGAETAVLLVRSNSGLAQWVSLHDLESID